MTDAIVGGFASQESKSERSRLSAIRLSLHDDSLRSSSTKHPAVRFTNSPAPMRFKKSKLDPTIDARSTAWSGSSNTPSIRSVRGGSPKSFCFSGVTDASLAITKPWRFEPPPKSAAGQSGTRRRCTRSSNRSDANPHTCSVSTMKFLVSPLPPLSGIRGSAFIRRTARPLSSASVTGIAWLSRVKPDVSNRPNWCVHFLSVHSERDLLRHKCPYRLEARALL